MSGRARLISSHSREELSTGWELASCAPGAITTPADPAFQSLNWLQSGAWATVAAALRSAGVWSLDGPERSFDAEDWWYRVQFAGQKAAGNDTRRILGLDGLATDAQAWLNGQPILSSDNMFISHEIAADALTK